jgi:hypothetical protein
MLAGNMRFTDFAQVVSAFVPIDVNAAAQTGDIVSLENYQRCAIIIFGAAGSAGTDITVTVNQMTDVSNSLSDAKALTFTRIDSKEGASLAAIGTFTTTTQTAAATYTTTNNEQSQQIYVFDFGADDLDIANDFDCIRVSINAGNAAKVMAGLYILYGPKFGSATLPSAIVD